MRNSTVIAHCLVNSGMRSLEEAERAVRTTFDEEFPARSFGKWNVTMNDQSATQIINSVGSASRIDVRKFIEDLSLWEEG
jgi:hypothetical protein